MKGGYIQSWNKHSGENFNNKWIWTKFCLLIYTLKTSVNNLKEKLEAWLMHSQKKEYRPRLYSQQNYF